VRNIHGVKNKYFKFLCGLVVRDGMGKDTYDLLLRELYGVDFYSLIPNDDNRGEDGKQLRHKFIDEGGQQALSLSGFYMSGQQEEPCTVLEMLIGLAFRLEFEVANSRWERHPSEWFWILIDNLGLSWCDNAAFQEEDTVDFVSRKVAELLQRHYKDDGNGGLFPLKDPKKDQRRIEIWYQMSAYMLENYPI